MSLPAPQPDHLHEEPLVELVPAPIRPGSGRRGKKNATGSGAASRSGLPALAGGLVVTVASVIVVLVAIAEVQFEQRIGAWTGVTLVVVSIVAPLVTRHGDRSLPAMMPPLAFLTAVLVAGQDLLPESENSLLTKEAVMVMQTLGPNAIWVIAATLLSVTIAAARHFLDRRAAKRPAATSAQQP